MQNNIIQEYLDNAGSNKESSDLVEAFAKKTLGLPVVSDAQKRLRFKDASNAEIQLMDSSVVNSTETFNVANDVYLNSVADNIDRFYIWDEGKGLFNLKEVLQVPLPAGMTMKDVKDDAASLKITTKQLLDEIYKKSIK